MADDVPQYDPITMLKKMRDVIASEFERVSETINTNKAYGSNSERAIERASLAPLATAYCDLDKRLEAK